MINPDSIHHFHAHIYFDEADLEQARALALAAEERFDVAVGRFHAGPVGPHPRGSCQLTVPAEQFGTFAGWLALNRDRLTVFAHATTEDELADHTAHVIWFGSSERLNLSFFGEQS